MPSLKNANIIHYLILLFKQHTKTGHDSAVVAANASAIGATMRKACVVAFILSCCLFRLRLEVMKTRGDPPRTMRDKSTVRMPVEAARNAPTRVLCSSVMEVGCHGERFSKSDIVSRMATICAGVTTIGDMG